MRVEFVAMAAAVVFRPPCSRATSHEIARIRTLAPGVAVAIRRHTIGEIAAEGQQA